MISFLLAIQVYAGQFKDDPRMAPILKELPRWRKDAMVAAAKALGVAAPPEDAVDFVFVDAASDRAESFAVHDGPAFETGLVKGRVTIVIRAEYLVSGRNDAQDELLHESIHAVMLHTLGEAHQRLPKWVREGLAVDLAGQGEEKIDDIMTAPSVAGSPESMIRPLDDKHGLQDYARDFLLMDYLRKEKRFEAFVAKIMKGEPLEDALGESVADFGKKAIAHALKEVPRHLGNDNKAYLAVVKLDQKGDWEGLLRDARAFVKASPKSRYATTVEYLAAKALHMLDKNDDALKALRAWMEKPAARAHGFADNALYRIGAILDKKKQHKEAAETFARIVREYPSNPEMADAAYRWGFSLESAGLKEESRAVLQKALKGFPDHKSADRARKALE